MEKIKVDPKVVCILVLVGLFAGWQYMILASAFALVICHKEETVTDLVMKVVILLAACTMFNMLWQLIYQGYDVLVASIEGFFKILNSISYEIMMPTWISSYLLNPLKIIMNVVDGGIDFFILLAKFTFVGSILAGTNLPRLFTTIQVYIQNFSTYVMKNIYPEEKTKPEESKKEPVGKFCIECGNQLKKESVFCSKCGTKQ